MSETDPRPTLSKATRNALEKMFEHRYGLYLYPKQGYSSQPHGPFNSVKTIEHLVEAGFAFLDASGGGHGSAKITEAGREFLVAASR